MGRFTGIPYRSTKRYFDSDATAYFARVDSASGLLDTNTKAAYNGFVLRAKNKAYFSKIKFLNLLIGDNLATAQIPQIQGGMLATATNINHVSGDYSLATGLQGRVGRFLNFGAMTSLPLVPTNFGFCAVVLGSTNNRYWAGPSSEMVTYRFGLRRDTDTRFVFYTTTNQNVIPTAGTVNFDLPEIGYYARAGNDLKVYRNGVLNKSYTDTVSTYNSAGNLQSQNDFAPNGRFGGFVFSDALTAQEVADLYANIITFLSNIGRS